MPGDVLDPVADRAGQRVQLAERVLALDRLGKVADGGVGPRLRGLLQEHARRNGLGEAGDHAVAVLGLDGAAGLDDKLPMQRAHA